MKDNIEKVDNGTYFGHLQPDARRLFIDEADNHIKTFCDELGVFQENVKIADLGGGNGILARKIVEKMGEKVSIDILDIDSSKFPLNNEPSINYKEHDAHFIVDKPYNALITRCVLHYNSRENQSLILRNIVDDIEGDDSFFTIIQPAPSEPEQNKINQIYGWLAENSQAHQKYFLTAQEILDILNEDSRIRVYEHEVLPTIPLTVEGFYRGRYKLSDSSTKELESLLSYEPVCMPTHIFTAIKK